MRTYLLPLYGLLLLALAGPGLAVDGVLEINQTCAVNTGCFSGDAAGFPVTINGSAGRSYLLTGDLVLPDVNTTGIAINTHDVAIDLNGFTIIGAGCIGATNSTCRPSSGSGLGIDGDVGATEDHFGHSVRNGNITGMGSHGIQLGQRSDVKDLQVRWNGGWGILAMNGSTLTGNAAYQNGGRGIFAASSTISGNNVVQNNGDGIYAHGSTIFNNTATRTAALEFVRSATPPYLETPSS